MWVGCTPGQAIEAELESSFGHPLMHVSPTGKWRRAQRLIDRPLDHDTVARTNGCLADDANGFCRASRNQDVFR